MSNKEKLIRLFSIFFLFIGCGFTGISLYRVWPSYYSFFSTISILFITFLFTYLCLRLLFKKSETEQEIEKICYDINTIKETLKELKKNS